MNASRMAAIGHFFLKYRKAGILTGVALDDPLLAGIDTGSIETGMPEDFARDLEALGPTFVKVGQALSTRPDFVPAPYIAALERMQDAVAAVDAQVMRGIVESELGVRINKLFATFDDTPIGSASLSQVYSATLRDGRQVAVKVQRPDVAATIREDLDMLAKLAGTAGMVSDTPRRYGFSDWIVEFRKTLSGELDYRREGENLESFARHLDDYPTLFVPQPIWDYSSAHVLTMERVTGVKVTRISELRRIDPAESLGKLAADLIRAYLDQIFVHGLIHADPHPGNVLLTADGRLALLDLGMVAHLPPRLRDQLLKLLLAVVDGRGEQAAETFAHLSTRLEDFDEANFSRETSRLIAQYASSPDSSTYSEGRLLLELTRVGTACGLRPPPELPLLAKTLLNLEAVSLALDPQMPLKRIIEGHLQDVLMRQIKQTFAPNRLASDLLEVQELLRESPRRLSQLLRTLSDNRFRVHITGLEESRLIESMQKIANRITAGIIAAGLILGAALMMRVPTSTHLFGYPALALILFLAAFLLGSTLVASMLLSDRKARPKEERDPI
ncbi:MAG TPA: AarF/UbiB family protein [Xanthomonadaceae bacterium]|nr:AarF/UbiB family protein [Xanthomonadaceae bacterium]